MADKRPPQTFSIRRIEALTDGVFAIAMTILVLDLKVPSLVHDASNGQLWDALRQGQTTLFSFALSFLLLASAWAVHQRQFEYIERSDRHLTFLNSLRLLVVVLVPFTVSLADDYGKLAMGTIWFPLNFALISYLAFVQCRYATQKNKGLASAELTEIDTRIGGERNLVLVFISLLVAVATLVVHSEAYILFVLTPFLMNIVSKHTATKADLK